jgi:hypothetical protein
MRVPAPARLPDWEARLSALIAARLREPFRWGAHDCALWGADVVAALTGQDFGAAFRGAYDDAEGAARALRVHGAGTVVRTFDRHLRRTPPPLARRGDLVRIPRSDAAPLGSLGVVIGSDALCPGDLGLMRVGRAHWSLGWRV